MDTATGIYVSVPIVSMDLGGMLRVMRDVLIVYVERISVLGATSLVSGTYRAISIDHPTF